MRADWIFCFIVLFLWNPVVQAGELPPIGVANQRVTTHSAFADTESEHVFVLTNQSDAIVRLGGVSVSCDCTTAKLEKTSLNPGESSELVVNFDFGDREGRQIKKFTVNLKDPVEAKPLVLTWEVHIPRVFGKPPTLVLWKPNDTTLEKQTRFVMSNLEGLRCVGFLKPGSDLYRVHWPQGLTAELVALPANTGPMRSRDRTVLVTREPSLRAGAYKLPLLFEVDGVRFSRNLRVRVLELKKNVDPG